MKILQLRFMLIVLRFIVGSRCHPDVVMEARLTAREIDITIKELKE